jgi:hypothetical protein
VCDAAGHACYRDDATCLPPTQAAADAGCGAGDQDHYFGPACRFCGFGSHGPCPPLNTSVAAPAALDGFASRLPDLRTADGVERTALTVLTRQVTAKLTGDAAALRRSLERGAFDLALCGKRASPACFVREAVAAARRRLIARSAGAHAPAPVPPPSPPAPLPAWAPARASMMAWATASAWAAALSRASWAPAWARAPPSAEQRPATDRARSTAALRSLRRRAAVVSAIAIEVVTQVSETQRASLYATDTLLANGTALLDALRVAEVAIYDASANASATLPALDGGSLTSSLDGVAYVLTSTVVLDSSDALESFASPVALGVLRCNAYAAADIEPPAPPAPATHPQPRVCCLVRAAARRAGTTKSTPSPTTRSAMRRSSVLTRFLVA